MKIRPLHDRIVVKRIEEQETTRNGIIIPDSAKEKPQEGEVIAVGNGKRLEDGNGTALDVKPATASCSENIPATKSSWTAPSTSSCARTMSSAFWMAAAKSVEESERKSSWQNRLFIAIIPARRFCAVSTSSPTR